MGAVFLVGTVVDFFLNVIKNIGDGTFHSSCSSSMTVTGNVNGRGNGSPSLPFVKKFSCKFCDKKFRPSAHLRTHERIQTGEKPMHDAGVAPIS